MNDNAIPKRSPWVMLAIHYIALVVLFVLLVYVVPKCYGMLRDFDADLPLIAQWVFICSSGTVAYWWLMLPLVLAADTAVLFMLTRLQQTQTWPATVWSASVLFAVGLMIVTTVIAIWLPMTELFDALT